MKQIKELGGGKPIRGVKEVMHLFVGNNSTTLRWLFLFDFQTLLLKILLLIQILMCCHPAGFHRHFQSSVLEGYLGSEMSISLGWLPRAGWGPVPLDMVVHDNFLGTLSINSWQKVHYTPIFQKGIVPSQLFSIFICFKNDACVTMMPPRIALLWPD